MKNFILNAALFVLIFFAMGIAFIVIITRLNAQKKYYSIPNEIHSIVIGHSHAACAFNDSVIDGFYNVAQNTEGYPYSYFKAKKLLEANNHIERIFVEYTNNQISPWASERIYGDYLDINLPRMFSVLDKKFTLRTVFRSDDISKSLRAIHQGVLINMRFFISNESNFVEHYWHNHKTPKHVFDKSKMRIKSSSTTKKFKDVYSVQNENLKYLLKIRDLCVTNDVQFYLVRSPLPDHIEFDNELVFLDIKDRYFKDVEFLDFKDSRALELHHFADNQHLNMEGSLKFSHYFNEQFSTGIYDFP